MAQNLIISLLFVWLSALTLAFYWKIIHNKKTRSLSAEQTDDLRALVIKLQKQSDLSIQRVGFLRFNPFKETGGAQSFAVALLNKDDDGFILTSLHSRGGTRTYAKLIQKGVSDIELSSEEQKALQLAKQYEIK